MSATITFWQGLGIFALWIIGVVGLGMLFGRGNDNRP